MLPTELSFRQRTMMAGARLSLLVSPRPAAMLIRKAFESSASNTDEGAPSDVSVTLDEPYGDNPDEVLDVYGPPTKEGAALPTVVWVHGGAFVGGSKEDMGGYMRHLAGNGLVAVAPRHTLAPEAKFPTPIRQVTAALRHLRDVAPRHRIDPNRFFLAGDSAGAMIAAQAGTVVTNPAYAKSIGIAPTISREQLRGYILCCGPYNLQTLMRDKETGPLIKAALWAYAGRRRFMKNEYFVSNMTLTDFVTDTFLSSYVTVGNADPLGAQSKELVSVLMRQGVDHQTLFYPDDHEPDLRHEYQFKMELEDAQTALNQILEFIRLRSWSIGGY